MTALLESTELSVRGDIRARVPLSTLERISVRGDDLEFTVTGERVALTLSAARARRWSEALATPPATLAHKFGITAATRLYISGTIDDAMRRLLNGIRTA